jgi:hypothetical protein
MVSFFQLNSGANHEDMHNPLAGLWDNSEPVIVPHLVKIAAKEDCIIGTVCIETLVGIHSIGEHAVSLPPVALGLRNDVRRLVGQ